MVPVLLLLPAPSYATTDYIEVLSGRSQGPLNDPQPNYATVPLRVAFSQDAEPRLRKIFGGLPSGCWEFQLEPFLELVTAPRTNVEFGLALGLKYTFETGGNVAPYLKLSTGPLYTTQDTLEQATRFNFGSQGSVGVQWNIDDDAALLLEARLRHFSNAGIETPNSGVDTNYLLVGYRWKAR